VDCLISYISNGGHIDGSHSLLIPMIPMPSDVSYVFELTDVGGFFLGHAFERRI